MKKTVVYVGVINSYNGENVYPFSRLVEIQNAKNSQVKNEKFSVWKLLERAFIEKFNVDFLKLKFEKFNDKWITDGYDFSLSHSSKLCSISLAEDENGIDIEKIDRLRFSKLKAEKLLCKEELEFYNTLSFEEKANFLNLIWVKKESYFKSQNKRVLNFTKINTLNLNFIVKTIEFSGETYFLCLYCQNVDNIEFVLLNDIKEII